MSEIWRPSAARIANSNLTRFMRCVNARRGLELGDYAGLYAWSVDEPADFWTELARFADVRAEWGAGPAIEHPERMPGAHFFPAARLNFAANLLKFGDERPALVFRSERGTRRALSYGELRAEVARIADGLRSAGVGAGDRVAGYLPNLPETTIAMLATASLGAIWSSCSPDFGVHGVLDRFGQIATEGAVHRRRLLLRGQEARFARADRGGAREAHRHRARGGGRLCRRAARAGAARGRRDARHRLGAIRRARPAARARDAALQPPALHPVFLRHHRRAQVHRARRRRHAAAASEGAPAAHRPDARRPVVLLHHLRLDDVELADERACHRRHAGALRRQPIPPATPARCGSMAQRGARHHLRHQRQVPHFAREELRSCRWSRSTSASLRTVLSTGSPLPPDGFDYVYRSVKSDVQLSSISGGTDIVSCFALGCPTVAGAPRRDPVPRARHGASRSSTTPAGRCAASAASWCARRPSRRCRSASGTTRTAAATAPPTSSAFPASGTTATTPRSPRTTASSSTAARMRCSIPAACASAPAEIYAAVESLPQIAESLAVGQDWQGDVRIVLFVRLQAGVDARRGAHQADPRHHPRP